MRRQGVNPLAIDSFGSTARMYASEDTQQMLASLEDKEREDEEQLREAAHLFASLRSWSDALQI